MLLHWWESAYVVDVTADRFFLYSISLTLIRNTFRLHIASCMWVK